MAIPTVAGSGYSRTVGINVVNRLQVKPPSIFIERTTVLDGEHITVKWKPSPYFHSIKVTIARDMNFTDIVKSASATNPEGTVLGIFPSGTYYLRAFWDSASYISPKGQ